MPLTVYVDAVLLPACLLAVAALPFLLARLARDGRDG